MRQGSTLSYLLGDHLGSTSVTANSSGAKTAEVRYKPWGEDRYTWGKTSTASDSRVNEFGLDVGGALEVVTRPNAVHLNYFNMQSRKIMREFKSNEDIYRFANEIMTQAQSQGDIKTVELLQNAIDRGGYLPSERLGELRLAFEQLAGETKEDYLIFLQSDIEAAIRYINEAFKRANRFR